MTWDENAHPRGTAGTFTDKPQSEPEAALTLPLFFVRSASGVHRYHAATEQEALTGHTELTGEHADPAPLTARTAYALAGPFKVEYGFHGDGKNGDFDSTDPDDTPYATFTITVEPEDLEPQEFSFRTLVPAYSSPAAFAQRAQQIAWAMDTRSHYGEEPAEIAERTAELLADQPDPAITPPQTAAEAAAMFPDRGPQGEVLGWYIVNPQTTARISGPHLTEEAATQEMSPGILNDARVIAAPVMLPSGNLAVLR